MFWRSSQAPKDEEEKREFERIEKELTGRFTYVLADEPDLLVEEEWLPEGMPDKPPAWW